IAFDQFVLKEWNYTPEMPVSNLEMITTQTNDFVEISGDDFAFKFSKKSGTISEYKIAGESIIKQGPKLNVWRAPTDNDGSYFPDGTNKRMCKLWLDAGLKDMEGSLKSVEMIASGSGKAVFISKYEATNSDKTSGFKYNVEYTIFADGHFTMDIKIKPFGELPNLPRLGFQLIFADAFNNFEWYGRGPHENYNDRKVGALIGNYAGTVDEQFTPYIVPQENGNKTDVRWAELTNSNGVGLKVSGNTPLETSVHHYSAQALSKAVHTYELEKENLSYWNIDYRQGGLGGNSCGPQPLEKYLLKPLPVEFTLTFEPVINK
ncbi:beta-galactosidase small subunit, partial [Draconibacterium sp.]|nr:beta-galactosidase small subunit [Draconibacterium sp.]